jgi:hypothetical protein
MADEKETKKVKEEKKKKDTVRQRKAAAAASTQRYLPIAEIKNNTVVLKNGGIRAVLQASSVNFNLKSEDEQNSLIYAYQAFLNTLEFPVQILIRSKKLDIDNYIENLKDIAENQTQPLLQRQTEEYIEYISKLVEYADIMEKKFYVVVPADIEAGPKLGFFEKFWQHMHPQDTLAKMMARERDFQTRRKVLTQRINIVKQGLENCNLRVTELQTQELIGLMYQVYNPITSREQKIEDLGKTKIETDE